jgi:hypothetical protein
MVRTRRARAALLPLLLAACAEAPPEGAAPAGDRLPAAADRARVDSAAPTASLRLEGDTGWAQSTSLRLLLSAEDDVGVTEMCLSATPRCARWARFAPKASVDLGPGHGVRTVYLRVRDAAGNVSAQATTTAQIDRRAPIDGVGALSPQPGGFDLAASGFTDGESGVVGYIVAARTGGGTPYCSTASAVVATGPGPTLEVRGLGPGEHRVRLCAVDAAGNQSRGVELRGAPQPDAEAPVATALALDGGAAFTADRAVSVTAEVTDNGAVERVCFAEAEGPCAETRPWAPGMSVDLSAGDGAKTVYATFFDAYGNPSAPVSARITLDRTAPTDGALTATPGVGQVQLDWSGAADPTSGIVSYTVVSALDTAPTSCASGDLVYAGPLQSATVTGFAAGERRAFRVCATDAAGNRSAGVTARADLLAEYDAPEVDLLTLQGGDTATITRAVELQIGASDASGLARMCVSLTPTCTSWRAFAERSALTLPDSFGLHAVYVWLEDTLGNRSASPATASITYGPDLDGDGFAAPMDCDDARPLAAPGQPERCNGVDDDCVGLADEADAVDPSTWHPDADRDGFGDGGAPTTACAAPPGHVAASGDCDDGDAAVHPGAFEVCDGADDDCDGLDTPEDSCGGTIWVADRFGGTLRGLDAWTGAETARHSGLGAMIGVAVDPAGNRYVSAYDAGQVIRVARDGTRTVLASGLGAIHGLTYDPATHSLLLAVPGGGRLIELRLSDLSMTTLVSGLSTPIWAFRFPGDDRVFVTERTGHRLSVVQGGVARSFAALSGPNVIAPHRDGGLLVTAGGQVWRVDRVSGAATLWSPTALTAICAHPEQGRYAATQHNADLYVLEATGAAARLGRTLGTGWGCATDAPVDADGDGALSMAWGGDDCDDEDGLIQPGTGSCPDGRSCREIVARGRSGGTGSYLIDPDGLDVGLDPFTVTCDMDTEGGGWTAVPYRADLAVAEWTAGLGSNRLSWHSPTFALGLTDAQINALRAISTEGRQRYVGLCNGVIHYRHTAGATWAHALGLRFHGGLEVPTGQVSLGGIGTVTADGCANNGGEAGRLDRATLFELRTPQVPLISVATTDNGDAGERYGSPLLSNPAWLR